MYASLGYFSFQEQNYNRTASVKVDVMPGSFEPYRLQVQGAAGSLYVVFTHEEAQRVREEIERVFPKALFVRRSACDGPTRPEVTE